MWLPPPPIQLAWQIGIPSLLQPMSLTAIARSTGPLHYPGDLTSSFHRKGQIWSRALWDIRGALGNVVADNLFLEAQFSFSPDTTMPAAAQATVDTAALLYDQGIANRVRQAFQARGILP